MDTKEIKSLLKQAKEAIKGKDFNTAIKHCKTILKTDKENYNAWVFIAAATQETGQLKQAETAFNKAIEISPSQLLAWHGLATFYDKQNNQSKHIDVLIKMFDLLANDKAKQLETMEKLITLSKSVEDKHKVIEIMQLQLKMIENEPQKEYKIWYQIFNELCADRSLSVHFFNLKHSALLKMIESSLFTEADCKEVISILNKCKDIFTEEETKLIKQVCLKFHDSETCLTFLLQQALNVYIEFGIIDENLQDIISKAEGKNNLKLLSSRGQSVLFIIKKQYLSALKLLKETLLEGNACLENWFLLCKVQLQLHLNKDAESSAKAGLQLAVKSNASSHILGHFYLFLGKALSESKCWDSSLKALEKSIEHLGRTQDTLSAFCLTLLEIELVDQAEKMCSELRSSLNSSSSLVLQLEGYLHLLKKEYSEALPKLKESCKGVLIEDSSLSLHLIGRVLWEMDQPKKAFEIFFKAAELDPFYVKNFLYLGQYYMSYGHDNRNARQCYQKAFDLDNSNDETARYLSNILRALGDDEGNFKVLKRITEITSPGSCKWAWTQLGLYQLEKNLVSDAISSLQNAVRADPLSSYGWQCLGEAYLKRGSYESAFKSFEKASELDPEAMYPLYQVCTIQQSRGLFIEAIEKYENLLHLDAAYIPALIGLAETWLLLGKSHFNDCLFLRAKDCFQNTLDILARVAVINVKLLCLWTLAGDTCTFCFHLGEEWFPLLIPSELQLISEMKPAACAKAEILVFGSKFYGQALSLKSGLSSLWHDLGVNCHFQSLLCQSAESAFFAKKAMICLQNAVSLLPSNHEHWTMLGIIAVSKDIQDCALGQHAFIKSIEIEGNNAEAWTNLGILYLDKENIQLAHQCFSIAQSLDPSFAISWIGQAMIADYVHHTETVDLYRHATTLTSHSESLIGYGRNICAALLDMSNRKTAFFKYNIEQMGAVHVAADYMQKYIANNNKCPEAYVFLGILFERQGLNGPALKAFKWAVDLFSQRGQMDDIEKSRINYARLLSKVGKNEDAIAEYLKLKKVDTPLLCSFAFTLYKCDQFAKSFEMFERALRICSTSSDKSHILAAMAMVAFRESEILKSVELLVKSFQMKPPSVFGLLALRAISITRNDPSLTATIQLSLRPLENDRNYSSYITLLSAIEAYNKEGAYSARNVFFKAVRQQPDNNELWMQAASCLLQWNPSFESVVSTCARIAVFHGGSKEMASQVFALSKLAAGYKTVSLRTAQKAVHLEPDKLSNWIVLATACHVSGQNRDQIGWIFSFVKKLAKQQGIKTELLGWLTVIEAYHYICYKDYAAANGLLKQACSISAFGSKISSVLQILHAYLNVLLEGGKIEPLVNALKNHPDSFLGWQLLIQVLLKSEKFHEAEKVLSQFVMVTSKFFPKLEVFPLLQIALLSYKAMKVSENDEKWIQIGNDAIGEAVKISPNNKVARFLQGLIAMDTKNIGLARRSLEKVVFADTETESLWVEKYSAKLLTHIYQKKNDEEALQKLSEQFSSDAL